MRIGTCSRGGEYIKERCLVTGDRCCDGGSGGILHRYVRRTGERKAATFNTAAARY